MSNELEKLVKKEILKVSTYQPGNPIEEVKREYGLKEVIKLASNENSLGASPNAVRIIKENLTDIYRYPDANCFYLKQKLASFLNINPEQMVIGNGSDEIIVLTLRAFVNPQDEVIIAEPTFLIYEIQARINQAKIVKVGLKNFKYDLNKIREAITDKTKIIFIANPDNPTGTYVTKEEVSKFLKTLPRNLIVYFDEAYYEFGKEELSYPDTLKYLNRNNIIITRSFSKAYGLAGLRVGYGISNPIIISFLNKVREPFNVNSLAQCAAVSALDDSDFLKKTIQTCKDGKKYLYQNFKRLGLKYVPSATNFVLVDVKMDAKKLTEQMLKKGVIVRDMGAWKLDSFIRITVGSFEENRSFIQVIEELLSKPR